MLVVLRDQSIGSTMGSFYSIRFVTFTIIGKGFNFMRGFERGGCV